ncbi:Hypothetical predicted protein [Mytilus galloprovincialis]|uniref:Uncharacterized protein n=1 Tax=Mytilus galloprovincialis TaxID=29158 RepID=A0A8B6G884_MYTGA|nr:Hypothetical predicted protein [Mytilus galloprovincialis]
MTKIFPHKKFHHVVTSCIHAYDVTIKNRRYLREKSKCYVLTITKKRKTINFNYNINGHILESVASNPYLGAELTNTMSWDKQVNKVVTKGNKALGFIRRNVGSCPEAVKKQAYLALVRPHLEYACSAWDPHLQKHIYQIEMVQRRAARFIKSNYSREPGTVTTLLEELNLTPLEIRSSTYNTLS